VSPHYRTLSGADLAALLAGGAKGMFVLDTRPLADYERGHVPGSLHCGVHELSRRQAALPPRASRLVVVAEPGTRSSAAANFLALIGYADVALLEGGIAAWTGPLEAGPPPAYDPRPKPKGWTDPPKRA